MARDPEIYDCASGNSMHAQCLYGQPEIEIETEDFTDDIPPRKFKINTPDDISIFWAHIEYIRKKEPAFKKFDDLNFLLDQYHVCPAPFILPLSIELLRIYRVCGPDRFPYPGGYLDQLNIYIQAATVISNEDARLIRIDRDNARQKT